MSSSTKIYNVIVFGDAGVGKTCFIDQFCYGRSFVIYNPDDSVLSHRIVVDDQASLLTLMDLSTSFLKPEHGVQHVEWAEDMLANAQGIVLLYDVTSLESFQYIIDQAYKFLWKCRRSKCKNDDEADDGREDFGCVLAGNKLDLAIIEPGSREVSQILAEDWAQTQHIKSIEMDSLEREGPECVLKLLARNIRKTERLDGWKVNREEKQEQDTKGKKKISIRGTLKDVFKSPRT
ncbi:uncharacterized protein EKO05_0011420 [Ascochyta rabiei]|uniref:uncharacterized protein n=1 Tax=Didymella rabiei TaxID=5454 RepID=UPI0019020156|nr:uncharacterized protein EKO05_0011420 [Ascochyta rabiei]UPX21226.1 hypothetical protein EKO05_0011420 [Ascochyta rabiei]